MPPHLLVRGGGHTRLRLKGWGSPNSNEGTYTVVLYIYKYFVVYCILKVVNNENKGVSKTRRIFENGLGPRSGRGLFVVFGFHVINIKHISVSAQSWQKNRRDFTIGYARRIVRCASPI